VKGEAYKRKADTRDELTADTAGAALRVKKRDDQLRRKTPDLSRRDARRTEADGEIFEKLL